jgi:SAM-dependent methyltransferase
VKGISKRVKIEDIPKEYRDDFLEAQSEIEQEHIEEDLEADRVNALYLMNHFLRVQPQQHSQENSPTELTWWQPRPTAGNASPGSPYIDALVRNYWDHGPFSQIKTWLSTHPAIKTPIRAIELGCGVGGLYRKLKPYLSSYLGIDGSFASISMARHLALGVPDPSSFRVPGDLLQGPISREVHIPIEDQPTGQVDWIVGDLESLPLCEETADLCIALNAIDMLDAPQELPKLQHSLLKPGGYAIQSCPYIWHEAVAKRLRKLLPKDIQDSARAAKWLYEQAGFKIELNQDHVPWLFFKHFRQIELYSVHIFMGKKSSSLNT